MRASTVQAGASPVSTAASIVFNTARLSPHGDIIKMDVVTRRSVWTNDLDRTTLGAIRAGPFPVAEGNVMVENAVTRSLGLGGPIAVEEETVCVVMSNKVLESDVMDGSTATIRLEHEHLVGIDGVYVVVGDMVDICVSLGK